jgi:hypothetical protein
MTRARDVANIGNVPTGFRNAIINGDFRINQRSFTSVTTTNTYGFDRWKAFNAGGTVTYTPQTFTLGSPAQAGYESNNFARLVSSGQSASSDYAVLQQPIEGVRTFANSTVTVSFWAKANSGTPKVAVELAQIFGAGGSPSADVNILGGQVTLSTSWARYNVQITLPSISGKTITTNDALNVNLWTSGGSNYSGRLNSLGIQNNTFDFWGVQVERGTVATPFEQRPIGQELILCKRYFEFSNGQTQVVGGSTGFGGNTYFSWVPYSVEKRIALSIVTNNTDNGLRVYDSNSVADQITMYRAATAYTSGNESLEITTTLGFGIVTTGGQTDVGLGRFFWYANAEL